MTTPTISPTISPTLKKDDLITYKYLPSKGDKYLVCDVLFFNGSATFEFLVDGIANMKHRAIKYNIYQFDRSDYKKLNHYYLERIVDDKEIQSIVTCRDCKRVHFMWKEKRSKDESIDLLLLAHQTSKDIDVTRNAVVIEYL